jgi:hypothetical protein
MTGQDLNIKTTYRCKHMLIRCIPETKPTGDSVDSKPSWLKQVKFRVRKSPAPQLLNYIDLSSHTFCPDCEKLLILRAMGRRSEDRTQKRGSLVLATQHETTNKKPAIEREVLSLPRRPIQHQRQKEILERHPLPQTPPSHQPSARVPILRKTETGPLCSKPDMQRRVKVPILRKAKTTPLCSKYDMQLRPSRDRQQLYKEPEVDPLTEEQGAVIWRDVCDLTQQLPSRQLESRSSVADDCSGVRALPSIPEVQIQESQVESRLPEKRAEASLGFSMEYDDLRRYAKLHEQPNGRAVSQRVMIFDDIILDGVSVASEEFDTFWRNEDISPLSSPTASPRGPQPRFPNDFDHYLMEDDEIAYGFI